MSTTTYDPANAVKTALKYGFGIFVSLWMLFPIYWMVTAGFKPNASLVTLPPDWLLVEFTLSHYQELFAETEFHRFLINSFVVSASAVVISVIIGVPAAYALSRMNVPARDDISFYILSTRMVPPLAILVPLFIFYVSIGINDSLVGLILTSLLITLPMIVWIVKGFIDELPESLEESAMVDGCNRTQAFLEVVVPLVKPGIAAAAFIGFIFAWNNFVLALVLVGGANRTAPLVIQSSMGYLEINWGMLGAAGTVTILPPVILSIAIRNHLVEGMTMGAVKE